MTHWFKVIKLIDHHNRGQFIVSRLLNFKEKIEVKEGALLNGFEVYHYLEMYPFSSESEKSRYDMYVFRPILERFPEGYFKEGQIVKLVIAD